MACLFVDALNCSPDRQVSSDWENPDKSACGGPDQQQPNGCYDLLNDDGRREMLGMALSFVVNPSRPAFVLDSDAEDEDGAP